MGGRAKGKYPHCPVYRPWATSTGRSDSTSPPIKLRPRMGIVLLDVSGVRSDGTTVPRGRVEDRALNARAAGRATGAAPGGAARRSSGRCSGTHGATCRRTPVACARSTPACSGRRWSRRGSRRAIAVRARRSARSPSAGSRASSMGPSTCRSPSSASRSTWMPRSSPRPCGATRRRTDGGKAHATTARVTSEEERRPGQQVCRFLQQVRYTPWRASHSNAETRMIARRLAALLACACITALAGPLALASPHCTKTCRRETAACTQTQCTGLVGKARRGCLETCRGIGGCTHIGTFAYVVSTCRTHAFHQQLMIRHGNCDPVRVLDFPEPLDVSPPCTIIGQLRVGIVSSPIVGAFHRLGVSRDGRQVVFEVTDDFSVIAANKLVAPGQEEGIFIVRRDGSGLRRLGPASRDPSFRFMPDPSAAPGGGFRTSGGTQFSFSPDGRAVVFTDLGPGPGADDAVQIFTLDVATGTRSQLTNLPAVPDQAVGTIGLYPGTAVPFFLPDGRIAFQSFGNLDGTNPEGNLVEFVMNRDGSDLRSVAPPVALRGGR